LVERWIRFALLTDPLYFVFFVALFRVLRVNIF